MASNWYALYTKPRSEKKVLDRLLEQEIEAYLPLQKKLRQWKDRKKWVEVPLINSYIFVKIEHKDYFNVLDTVGSSPRLWGTLKVYGVDATPVRFIPTAVGNAPTDLGSWSMVSGSSPRLWGTHKIQQCWH